MLRNMVKESAVAPGTGTTVTLSGAQAGFVTFAAAFGSTQLVYYIVTDGAQHEMQSGTLTVGSPNTLARGTPIWTSTGGASRLNFTSAVTVYNVVPASQALYLNPSNRLDLATKRIVGLSDYSAALAGPDDAARMDQLGWRSLYTIAFSATTAGVAISLPTGYHRLKILFDDVITTTQPGALFYRWSMDNMTTTLTTAAEYRSVAAVTRSTGVVANAFADNFARLGLNGSGAIQGEINLSPRGDKRAQFWTHFFDTTPTLTMYSGIGNCATNTATPTTIFISAIGDTLAQGRFRLMGALL